MRKLIAGVIMGSTENVLKWHRWVVESSAAVISQVFDELNQRLPPGWKRLAEDELLPYASLVMPGSGWYRLEMTPDYVGVILSIEQLGGRELRGGRVWFAGPPYPDGEPSIQSAWNQVIRFLEVGIVPAVEAVGAEIRIPTAQEIFLAELPFDVRDRLRNFAANDPESFEVDEAAADSWREFVIAAFRANVVIDPFSFEDWLVVAGWSRDLARSLYGRFLADCGLLLRYKDEVSAA